MTVISIGSRPCYGSETIVVDATAGGVRLTATKLYKDVEAKGGSLLHAQMAVISVEDAEIRVSYDPAATLTASDGGHVVPADTTFQVDGASALDQMRFIRTGGTNAEIHVTYFG